MFQSFTGSSRRPRQVNLSGRTPHPFAAVSSIRPPAGGPAAQNTLAVAQQERLARQQERDRLNAARQLQRIWRGHKSRRETHRTWRTEWDNSEQQRQGRTLDFREAVDNSDYPGPLAQPYLSETDCWMQLKLLLHFIDMRNQSDIMRLIYLSGSLQSTLESHASISDGWAIPLLRLGDLVLRILSVRQSLSLSSHVCADLLELLNFLSRAVPDRMSQYSNRLYKLLAGITTDSNLNPTAIEVSRLSLIGNVLAPLQTLSNQTPAAYRDFAMEYLTTPGVLVALGDVEGLAAGLNYMLLFKSIIPQLRDSSSHKGRSVLDGESRLWLLASLIYFHRYAHGSYETKYSSEPDFIEVISILLSAVANDVAVRIDLEDEVENGAAHIYPSRRPHLKPLPNFVRREVLSLLEQNSIKSLLAGMTTTPQLGMGGISNPASSTAADAKVLASYALTLLRVFHKHGNDIRLWLFLGSVSAQSNNSQSPMSAVKYFWVAATATTAFHAIMRDHRAVLDLLKPNAADINGPMPKLDQEGALTSQDWRVILIFLELYTYVLQVMDDEEFLSGGGPLSSLGPDSTNALRQNALPLEDVQRLTVFLKNLAFSLYWNGSSLIDSEGADEDDSIRSYFSPPKTPATPQGRSSLGRKSNAEEFSDFVGMSVEDMKGLVTGVLRMIYERDSRRKFLPKDHWLMTGRFDDMEGFIPAVVAEHQARENKKRELGESGETSDDLDDDVEEEGYDFTNRLIGNARAQRTRNHEYLARRQRRASRKKYYQSIAPRLEILENMPFFIPFATRVQIFRQFIHDDQVTRRNGMIDPDNWRMSIMSNSMRSPSGGPSGHEIIRRHHANIHRESVFEDAYDQFYSLGEGLKEPIQITFVDKFDTVEAGIDGGGVTKEFLTSVTNEAFDPSNGLNLFLENEQHLLYPDPTSVEHRKDLLRQAGFVEGLSEWNHHIRELLKRYEFLGRVIGKCLYEGILVDVNFVGFFLLKWALTGGAHSAAKETQYRATFNDLRDLDEGLYQGLLQLKNYAGDVEDFALNFTITDTIPLPGGAESSNRTITRDLTPNGSDIPVTNQNRLPYIQYVARHRLQNQPALQTHAFLRGLQQIITPSWLSMFNQAELQTLVGGVSADIDVADLRRNTLYGGLYVVGDDNEEHPTIKLFWEVMKSMVDADRRKVLKFVTSTPRAPLLGFGHLNPRFSIRDSSDDQDRLPSTSTCVNLLKLPRYANADTLREKLLYAVNAGAGFDLS